MPIAITLILNRASDIVKQAGVVTAVPALEPTGRLYVIHNPTTSRDAYIGTATDVQQRFVPRLAAIRELGFNNAAIQPITIYSYRVTVNGQARQPDNQGYAGGYDVEHLLIRLHLRLFISVRQFNKIHAFSNNTGQRIDLRVDAANGLAVPAYLGGVAFTTPIASGTNL
jgi:hypothetical protein